ncbi:MAG: carboxylating nicotinate-nucleotide diphosphorylase [Gammaproteobacteria bacterium]|nr:carboxylating nicotinate-nucleotide diphosphorylase [Gammaproteobacteria bacterium]MDH3406897.1 carboxylating nicotinate-nucleotide diphosphorylase [Gammaproteobacteria bacterium]MDH5486981.1 carboxylating nicotinate-nucleotide diphosphorylase [Gammaproteobacteria bacterium]
MPTLPEDIAETVRTALSEDIGAGDLTAGLITPEAQAQAQIITREDAVLCGTAWCDEVFRQLDSHIHVDWTCKDGDAIHPGQTLCNLRGPARALLTGERTALNFLQLLSGTATLARKYVEAVRGTRAIILDTRKTVPGLRRAQKYAVACAGGQNHRLGLFDAILIKENHIEAAGSITDALHAAKISAPPGITVEIEVENLEQVRETLQAGATRILLDNFSVEELKAAVREANGRALLEASGGISLSNIRAIAETGVDFISIGDITKNISAVDLSLRFRHRD